MPDKGPSTELIHHGEGESLRATPLTLPIYETTTYVFDSAQEVRDYAEGKSDKYLYSRYSNPTVVAVESKIAVLEGAAAALIFSSGMAATSTALLALLKAGDEVVCSSAIYGGTLHLITDLLSKLQVRPRFVSLEQLREPRGVIGTDTRLLWFESPINPTLRCVNIGAIADACREREVTSIIDNTFATPINQSPLARGIDICMHSATKYLNGHSDVTAGALAGPASLLGPIGKARRLLGTVLDPYAAYALGRGLKTLALRVARHNSNAAAVAAFLAGDSRVQQTFYPGLECHPDHAVARAQMRGFGGMVCIELNGGFERAARFFDRLRIFKRAASLGGPESLCSLPVLTSQWGHSDEELRQAGVTAAMARLSIGLEDPEDLIADLDQALG